MSEQVLYPAYEIFRKKPENYVEGELDFCKREFEYRTNEVKLIQLNQCFVNDQGYVFDKQFRINKISLLDPAFARKYTLKHRIKNAVVRRKEKTNSSQKYLLTFDEWSHGHYHWFCDVLPRIYSVKDDIQDYCLLLPDSSLYIKTIGLETLKMLKIYPKEIVFIKPKALLSIKNLFIVSHVSSPGYINDQLVKGISTQIREHLNLPKSGQGKKLYISRSRASYRKVINEAEVENTLKEFGFDTVYFEELNLKQQIELTSSASTLVSIHGAGLTNMFFLPPNSKVIEFRRDKIYHNQCYWHLADALGHKYYYLFGEPDDKSLVIEGRGCNITVDISNLAHLMDGET